METKTSILIIETGTDAEHPFPVLKFIRSASLCMNRKALVRLGGQGESRRYSHQQPRRRSRELSAFSHNLLVAFMPWEGRDYKERHRRL